jgi:hypothetical protein
MENNISEESHFDTRTENEIKKLKLSVEHGMDCSSSHFASDLAPEAEGQFLDYISAWEEQFALKKRILVYDFIGQPAFSKEEMLNESEVSAELQKIMEMLNNGGIDLSTLCEVGDRELYRFITEELFKEEINDIRIPGMMSSFIYEDFYPNHAYDIKNRCTEIIDHVFTIEESKLIPWGLDKNVIYRGKALSKEALNDWLISFKKEFSEFNVKRFEYTSVMLNEKNDLGTAIAQLQSSGTRRDGKEVTFNGRCIFKLRCEYEWWLIYDLELPGLNC